MACLFFVFMKIDNRTGTAHKIVYGKNGDEYHPLLIDNLSKSQVIIDVGHYYIHEGDSFTAYYTVTTAATNGHRSGLYLKTPSESPSVKLIVSFSASTAAIFSICEAPTIAANTGTHNNAIYNRCRDSIKISHLLDNSTTPLVNKVTTLTEAQIAGDGTWATGTVIRTEPLVAGADPKPAGGSGSDAQEYILKSNTKYVFLLTNTVALANTHHILIDWKSCYC